MSQPPVRIDVQEILAPDRKTLIWAVVPAPPPAPPPLAYFEPGPRGKKQAMDYLHDLVVQHEPVPFQEKPKPIPAPAPPPTKFQLMQMRVRVVLETPTTHAEVLSVMEDLWSMTQDLYYDIHPEKHPTYEEEHGY